MESWFVWTVFAMITSGFWGFLPKLVVTYATYTYNERQMQLALIKTLDKYRSYINSEDRATREYGYFVFEELGYPKLADKLADVREDPSALKFLLSRLEEGSGPAENSKAAQIADNIMRKAASPKQDTIPSPISTHDEGILKKGWVYLGHFVSGESDWETRYLDFSENEKPPNLVGEKFKVREKTGTLNVRKGMPTVFGQFRDVQDVLDVGSMVTIIEYSEWHSSGYIWAKVSYSK